MSVIRGLYDRWRHLVHEVAKFGVVGAVAYIVDVGIFNLLSAKDVNAVIKRKLRRRQLTDAAPVGVGCSRPAQAAGQRDAGGPASIHEAWPAGS